MRFPTMWYVRPAKAQSVKLPARHHLEFLGLKGGCIGSSESTLVKYHIVRNHMSWLKCKKKKPKQIMQIIKFWHGFLATSKKWIHGCKHIERLQKCNI